jgi:hypothetical protein
LFVGLWPNNRSISEAIADSLQPLSKSCFATMTASDGQFQRLRLMRNEQNVERAKRLAMGFR